MNEFRLTLRLQGKEENGGDVLFNDFIKQLEAFKIILADAGRRVSGGKTVEFKVVELSHNSPAMVGVEPIVGKGEPDYRAAWRKRIIDDIESIQDRGVAPDDMGTIELEHVEQFGSMVGDELSEATILVDGREIPVSPRLKKNVKQIVGEDEYSKGSLTGMLEAINVHGDELAFWIYPPTGRSKVRCVFPEAFKDRALVAFEKYVTVYGWVRFKQRDSHAYRIDIEEIEIHEQDDLPTLADFKGIAPDATGGIEPHRYARAFRSA